MITIREITCTKSCTREKNNSSICYFSGIKFSEELFTLKHDDDFQRKDINVLKFVDSEMVLIPLQITKTYENVKEIHAQNISLYRLLDIDFNSSNLLQRLNASNNLIRVLGESFNIELKKLEILDLSHNQIRNVNGKFAYSSNLKFLNLSYNQISHVSLNFTRAVRNVRTLDLSHNQIKFLENNLGDLSFGIQTLRLEVNKLMSVPVQILKNLTRLDISANMLGGEVNINGTNLKDLNIGGNEINSLTINKHLEVLNASNNKKVSFKINFGFNSQLKHLNLSNINNKDYENIMNDLKNLSHLESIDLSHNNLTTFDFKALPSSLKVLNVKETNLMTLVNSKNLENQLSNLKEINILGNSIDCAEFSLILKNLIKLNITVTGYRKGHEEKFVKENCKISEIKENRKKFVERMLGNVLHLIMIIAYVLISFTIGIINITLVYFLKNQ